MSKRKRSSQTTSLEERVARFTEGLRQQAENLSGDAQEALELKRRITKGEAALRINASLSNRPNNTSGQNSGLPPNMSLPRAIVGDRCQSEILNARAKPTAQER
jgi:hypothetical protein